MTRATRYPPELRERAIRLVREHRSEHPSEWAAIQSVAAKLGMTPEILRIWLRRDEVDHHQRPGVTSAERERIRELERENRELRRANEILKAASAFFARELDPRLSREVHRRAAVWLGSRADLPGPADRSEQLLRRDPPAALSASATGCHAHGGYPAGLEGAPVRLRG